jgi:membrane peptidoglycan carboxypeptidase
MALGHSRNIPSVKMFLALGGEPIVKPFYQSLGLTHVLDTESYGYSLSL